jgi:DNA topoisomerase-1
LAQWKENINNQVKYMQLAAQSSSSRGKSDRKKYNKAALLCEKNIVKIRAATRKSLKSKDMERKTARDRSLGH